MVRPITLPKLGQSELDWVLYLPQAWSEERVRCRKAGVPDSTPLRTKGELALEWIDHLLQWGLRRQPILADAGYGNHTEFRQRSRTQWFGTSRTRRVQPRQQAGRGHPQALSALATTLPAERWRTVTWRQGSRGT
jgi:hypothetical protein